VGIIVRHSFAKPIGIDSFCSQKKRDFSDGNRYMNLDSDLVRRFSDVLVLMTVLLFYIIIDLTSASAVS